MPKIDCPNPVRQHYGKLSQAELREEIEKALDHPGAEHTQLWVMWIQWLVQFSVQQLRPTEALLTEEIRLCRWLAFALRYLHPLHVGKERPQSADSVMNIINNSPYIVSQILFGAEIECLDALKMAFDPKMLTIEGQPKPEYAASLRSIQFRSSEEKTARNWSDALLEPLKAKVFEYFHPVEELALRELSQGILNAADTSATSPSLGYRAQLEWYVKLAVTQNDRALYGQARGYLNEFDKAQL